VARQLQLVDCATSPALFSVGVDCATSPAQAAYAVSCGTSPAQAAYSADCATSPTQIAAGVDCATSPALSPGNAASGRALEQAVCVAAAQQVAATAVMSFRLAARCFPSRVAMQGSK
jgi:hypothetical protein